MGSGTRPFGAKPAARSAERDFVRAGDGHTVHPAGRRLVDHDRRKPGQKPVVRPLTSASGLAWRAPRPLTPVGLGAPFRVSAAWVEPTVARPGIAPIVRRAPVGMVNVAALAPRCVTSRQGQVRCLSRQEPLPGDLHDRLAGLEAMPDGHGVKRFTPGRWAARHAARRLLSRSSAGRNLRPAPQRHESHKTQCGGQTDPDPQVHRRSQQNHRIAGCMARAVTDATRWVTVPGRAPHALRPALPASPRIRAVSHYPVGRPSPGGYRIEVARQGARASGGQQRPPRGLNITCLVHDTTDDVCGRAGPAPEEVEPRIRRREHWLLQVRVIAARDQTDRLKRTPPQRLPGAPLPSPPAGVSGTRVAP